MATDIFKEEYNNVREENDRYRQLNSQLKDHLVCLDREWLQIAVADSRIQEKLAIPGGIVKHQGKHRRHIGRIRILENELHQDTIRFNKLMCSNADYREKIALLQQQKVTGWNIEEKLNRHLATQQSIMDKLEVKLSLAFNLRSEGETRMQEMRESMEVETLDFIKRRMELMTVIHHDAKLQAFMETKLQEIALLEEDEDSKKREKQLQNQNGGKKSDVYLQAYNTLVEMTGERDLCQIERIFIRNEERNFALINYINEQHYKLNKLKRCVNKRKSDILFLELENKRLEEQRAKEFQELESEVEKNSCVADSLEKQCAVVQKRLDELTTGISSLYAEIMQTSVTVTLDNVVHVLSTLEDRIIELLLQANMRDEPPQKLLLGNFDLLPEGRKSQPRSPKFARSDGK